MRAVEGTPDIGEDAGPRITFQVLWLVVLALKLAVASMLPLFVDEAFYWQEGQHLAPAYSDLPGLTAWLARLGVEIGGHHALALRAPFIVIASLVPLLVVRIAAREFGERSGWIAGCFALLLPLSGTLGVLALPDPAMALATLLCVDAGARLLRRVDAATSLELAAGLSIGALSHYRFLAVIVVGFIALVLLADGRRALRDPRVWIAIALGASAWAPLIAWNLDNADAGLRFQLVDRHPWAFHADGAWFVVIQALLVTPLLFIALLRSAWRGRSSPLPASRYFALLGGLIVGGFFVLGFFADTERVSFHWPLPGYLALLPLLPGTLERWSRPARMGTWLIAGLGLVATLGYYIAVSIPQVRARAAAEKWYPSNFAGWEPLAEAVRDELGRMPPGTRLVADNFKIGAELGFALGNPSIPVLDHPLNRKHGRAPQLQLWGLQDEGRREPGAPTLLVVGASDVKFSELLERYQQLCEWAGPLPPPRTVDVDHGRQRFALFALPPDIGTGLCKPPALAHIVSPLPGAATGPTFDVEGWAVKDHVGIESVTVTLDGQPVATARYGVSNDQVAKFWKGRSRDPNLPHVWFVARVDASSFGPGTHWLGLILHASDGRREAWPEQPLEITR